jgi:hypothetical protein
MDITDDLRKQISDKLVAAGTVKDGDFKLAVVKQSYFHDRPFCPHCATATLPEVKWVVNEDSGTFITGKVVGDIALCKLCFQPILILLYPIIPLTAPIFLHWKKKEEEVKSIGDSEHSVGEALSANDGTA